MRLVRQGRRGVRRLLEDATGGVLLRRLPHGVSAYLDLKRRKPDMDVLVDVGANVGQTAAALTATWPTARVFCIEPFAATFDALQRATADQPRVSCFRCAFGSRPAQQEVFTRPGSVNNSLLGPGPRRDGRSDGDQPELVTVTTFDAFREEHGLEHVDFLKIDTEGYDLEVVKGASSSLDQQRVSFVQVEAGMTRHNAKHVPFGELQEFLEQVGYVLFGIYDQTPEWDGQARLRFANPVFIADSEVHRRPTAVPLADIRGTLLR